MATWPEDVPAQESLAYALWSQGRTKESLAVYEDVLQKAPRREQCLLDAATISEQFGLEDRAIAFWGRAAEANPWSAMAHYHLADLLAQRQNWKEAIAACSKAVQLLPSVIEQRFLLVDCYLRTGQKDKARTEFTAIEILNPPDLVNWRQWFKEHSQ